MKIGDTIPVTIAGQEVCRATVKGMEDGTATLVVPATLVVMATRTELTVEQREPEGAEVVITGVDRVNNNAESDAEGSTENNVEETPETNNMSAHSSVEPAEAPSEPVVENISDAVNESSDSTVE